MSSESNSPREFHYFPRLPPEIRDMIWDLHGSSIVARRHHLQLSLDSEGKIVGLYACSYLQGAPLPATPKFRQEQDNFSLAYGALTLPCIPDVKDHAVLPDHDNRRPLGLGVNYNNDLFCFGQDQFEPCIGYGRLIAGWFNIPLPPASKDASEDDTPAIEGIDKNPVDENETDHGIYSVRRLAFHVPSGSRSMPNFQERDLQVLSRFKRLRQIILVVDMTTDLPPSILRRTRPAPHQCEGTLSIITDLNPEEHIRLLKGHHRTVKVTYALDNPMATFSPYITGFSIRGEEREPNSGQCVYMNTTICGMKFRARVALSRLGKK